MAKQSELRGPTTAAAVGGVLVLILDKIISAESLPLLLRIFLIGLGAMAAWLGQYYHDILGGAKKRQHSEERDRYDALRQRLAAGGTPAIVYNRWLTVILGKVDAFFRDAGRKDKSWIARVLYLETDGPRWTAVAFDRCLLLALVYPVATVFAAWAWSGHVGVAEHALILPPDNPADRYAGLQRALAFFAVIFTAFAYYRFKSAKGLKSWLWLFVALGAMGAYVFADFDIGAGVGVGVITVTCALVFAIVIGSAASGDSAQAVAVALVVALVGFVSIAGAGAVAGTVAITCAVGGGGIVAGTTGISAVEEWAKRKDRLGLFLALFSVAVCCVCFAVPYIFAPHKGWTTLGARILFFGLLTMVNAPIDWLAIGFTRALLRRGLALRGWWPFLFALADVLVAALLIAILAFAMVLAVQTFDDIAVLRAGPDARILPLVPLFERLESDPGDFQYWWIWFLLFSSVIPSILNLTIATTAFLRGLPPLNTWILRRMHAGKAMSERDRLTVAAALTAQPIGGVALTGAAVYLVAVYLIPIGLPDFGAAVRDFAADLGDYNAPARALMWIAGTP